MSLQRPLQFRKRVLAAKVETTYGTVISVANTDAGFRCFDRKLDYVGNTVTRERQGALGNSQGARGAMSTKLTFQTHFHGSGASGDPTWASTFLPCLGMSSSAGAYTCTSDNSTWRSLTASAYQDGRVKQGRGMMGNLKLTLTAGMPAVADWDFMGGWVGDPSGASMLTGMTYDAVQPLTFSGTGSLTLNSSADFKIKQLVLDWGNQVALREDPNSAGGYIGAWIGNRLPKITMDPEAMAFATENWYAAQTANTEVALSIVLGTVTHNIITIVCGAIQLEKPPEDVDRDGKLVDNLGFLVDNDDLSVTFT